jgi:hypothetical protein
MASPDAHITKAKHNIKTIVLLSQDLDKKDWIVTVAFYSALHIVDAVLFYTQNGYNKHGRTHDKREEIIKSDRRLDKIWDYYRPLLNESIIARYLQGSKTPPDIAVDFDKFMPDEKLTTFIKERLGGIINSAIRFIPEGKDLGLKEAFQTELKDFLGLKDG